MNPRVARLTRGVLTGTVSTVLALAFHVVAGGDAPSAFGLWLAFGATIWIATVLGRGRFSWWLVSAAVAIGQIVLHFDFEATTSVVHAAVGEHAGHTDSLVLQFGSLGHSMWWGHALAGILTVAWVRFGEALAVRLVERTALAWRAVVAVRIGVAPRRRVRLSALSHVASPRDEALVSGVGRRGPPSAFAC